MNYPSYEDAKRIVREKGIKSQRVFRAKCKELGLPSNPNYTYKEEWIDWHSFFGKETITHPSYEGAKKRVIEAGIMGAEDYRSKYKELGLPSNPNNFYKEEWKGWPSFLGKEAVEFPPYEDAKRIVKEKGIKSANEYKVRYKELGLPSEPKTTYRDKGWSCWDDFFDTKEISYEEAHRRVVAAGIKSGEEYKARCKELGLQSHPDRCYKDKGWVDWPTFLGKSHKVSHKERRTKVLSRMSLDPILLDDKAPLQVLYMVASCVDKNLAREIETLLDSSTPEDRLNWVKEQLKDVKEETTSRDGTTSASLDEVSAMESMMDVFEDTFEDLSEEDSTNIKIILENYYHNVINKELIGECDG